MEQHFAVDPPFNLFAFEEISYDDLPVISPNEINGYLAEIEHQQPIAPFTEVKIMSFKLQECNSL